MKTLLGCLMCLVFTLSQSFAISGGPFGGKGHVQTTGIYAGVFVPIPTVVDPGPPPVTLTDNSLGLFTLTVPKTGLATGTTAVFRNGFFYSGTIQGSADPDTAKLTGVVNATFTENVATVTTSGGTTTTITFIEIFSANGQLNKTQIVANTNLFAATSARIKGTSSLTYTNTAGDPNGDSGGPIEYKVKGFKQANQ
jgi:hypothetical protein